MYLYSSVKILLVFVFQFEEIFRVRAIILENDITKPLDKWFASIFTFDANENKVFRYFGEKELKNIDTGEGIFESLHAEKRGASQGRLEFNFSTNILSLVHENVTILIWGKFSSKTNPSKKSFKARIAIENITIIAVPLPDQSTQLISKNSSWDRFTTEFANPMWADQATKNEEEEIRQNMPAIFSKTLSTILNHDETLKLNTAFQHFVQPRNELFSKNPKLLESPEQFHYLITTVPFYSFTLKRIVIANLSNLDSFKMALSADFFTHTLLVNDIKGSMILDYKSEKEASLKLKFKIGNLHVIEKKNTNCVLVQADYYEIVRAKSNVTLSGRQAQVLIRGLEFAIASSILPSMKVGKVCSIETPLNAIKITNNVTDWETVKKSYKELIPFNDDVW